MILMRCAALAVALWLAAATAAAQSFEADVAPLVQASCVRCHGARTITPLNLDSLGFNLADHDTFQAWETVYERLERGETEPENEKLFSGISFKDALPEVSRYRLEQTLYAEHADKKPFIERLRGAKAELTPEALAEVWELPEEDAAQQAASLVEVGFFRAPKYGEELTYWVPFLYRPSLELVQGRSD